MERYNESSDVRQLFRGAVQATKDEATRIADMSGETTKRVAAYCRVSTDSESQETSIETQRAYFEHEIRNHPGWKLVQIYADQGVTGTISMKRPAFRQMIEDALAGKIDVSPAQTEDVDACKYCPYRSVCGFDESLPGCQRRVLNIDSQEALRRMKEEDDHA